MNLNSSVRLATLADVPAITRIYNEAVVHTVGTAEYEPVSEAAREQWLSERLCAGYPVLVLADEVPLGFAALGPWVAREGYRFTAETAVYVAREAWGKGVATELMTELVAAARKRGYRNLVARIAIENEASIRAHRRTGFVEVGRLPEVVFKFGRWIDIGMFQLRLQFESRESPEPFSGRSAVRPSP